MQKVRGQAFPGSKLPGYSPSTDRRQTVSDSISLPSTGFFSPFPHGTCSLSVDGTYLALEGGPPRFPQTFTWSGVLGNTARKTLYFRLQDCHPLWCNFPKASANGQFCNSHVRGPTTPQGKPPRFGLLRFRSPLLTQSIFLSFPVCT